MKAERAEQSKDCIEGRRPVRLSEVTPVHDAPIPDDYDAEAHAHEIAEGERALEDRLLRPEVLNAFIRLSPQRFQHAPDARVVAVYSHPEHQYRYFATAYEPASKTFWGFVYDRFNCTGYYRSFPLAELMDIEMEHGQRLRKLLGLYRAPKSVGKMMLDTKEMDRLQD